MQLGEKIDLGSGITGKVIGRTFEQDMRIDLMTPWGVLNGVRLSALAHGLVLNPDREDVKTVGAANDDVTVSLETPWGKLNAVPVKVLELHAERRRQMPQAAREAEAERAGAAESSEATAGQAAAVSERASEAPSVRLGRWPRRGRQAAERLGRQVA